MDSETVPFGDWLDTQLRDRRWTQTDFAVMLGTSQSTVSGWVNGAARPRRRACRQIAEALSVSVDEVLALAGYVPIRPYRTGTTVMDADAADDLQDAIDARLHGENVSAPRIWASMDEALSELGATDHDKEVIARFVEFTLAESRRKESEST